MTINKWGALASLLMAVSFVVAPWIYLTGNLKASIGVFSAYDLADFLYGPVLSASLITALYVLRERIGRSAFRRMDLALVATVLSAARMAAVAFIRASNRHYHLIHPELDLENSTTVLIVWTTLVAGMNSFGFHFLGWAFILLGSASWSSRLFPRAITVLYFAAGIAGMFVYLLDGLEGLVLLLGIIIGIWHHGKAQTEQPELQRQAIVLDHKGKIVEHWDVLQTIPEKSANDITNRQNVWTNAALGDLPISPAAQ